MRACVHSPDCIGQSRNECANSGSRPLIGSGTDARLWDRDDTLPAACWEAGRPRMDEIQAFDLQDQLGPHGPGQDLFHHRGNSVLGERRPSDPLQVNQGSISGRGREPWLECSPAHPEPACQFIIGKGLIGLLFKKLLHRHDLLIHVTQGSEWAIFSAWHLGGGPAKYGISRRGAIHRRSV